MKPADNCAAKGKHMLKNYLLIAFRNLIRRKSFSILNIFGLTIGLTCSILIFLWVQDEMSYDSFNSKATSTYRITASVLGTDLAVISPASAPAFKSQIPEIKNATRVKTAGYLFYAGTQMFDEKNVIYADSNFLQMFDYGLIEGDRNTVLSTPDAALITEDIARKYFGTSNALGKTLRVNNDINPRTVTITGILKSTPYNSHLHFDIVLPFSLYQKTIDYDGSWGNSDVFTYVQLNDNIRPGNASIQRLQKQMEQIQKKNSNVNEPLSFTLQPLKDIHLKSGRLLLDVDGQGNIQHVGIFSLIAIFILLIACINFMNLATALSRQRAKEVGLRKVIGAVRIQLIAQFLGESVLLSFIALAIALLLAYLLLPMFNSIANKHITLSFLSPGNTLLFIAVSLITGLIAGSYPAVFLSSFKPALVLKGIMGATFRGVSLRNGLVVVQFAISVILIVSTVVVYTQLHFIRNRNIGFDKENLVYVQTPQIGDMYNNLQALKASLTQVPSLGDYTITNYLPTYLTTGSTNVEWQGKDPAQQTIFPHLSVDANFVKTFGMKMKSGRFFSDEFKGDDKNYVINETALKLMKLDAASAIGQPLTLNGRKGEIIGVVNDFNFKPVQQAIEPLILKANNFGGYVVIRTRAGEFQSTIKKLRSVFEKVYPNAPFEFNFLDKDLERLYLAEQQMGKLFNIFALVSIFVSSLGLFGLAAFTAQKRVKEIGIRKILGATESSIVAMLSKDFLKLVFVSLLIAFPVAWWMMNQWLQNYVYRIHLSWWMFVAAGVLAIVIAFATISIQAIKAAIANPVKSLRTDA